MLFVYNLIVVLADFILKIVALFSKKIKLFVEGRKLVFKILSNKIKYYDKTIWFHSASLGEYEQGLPVMERMKSRFPNHLIVLTFFSPSGYEVRKNNTIADVTVYLPLDTQSNVEQFMKIVRPDMAFFIKYEYWPNYLKALQNREIPTYLISGIFREKQVFFKWYGGFYRKALDAFEHFFVQNSVSKEMLLKLGKTNVTVSGDTRFDRVSAILNQNNQLDFIDKFKNNTLTIVAGSSWPKDEALLVNYINSSNNGKFIIAPHNINEDQIADLKNQIAKKTILFSSINLNDLGDSKLAEHDVLIIDTIGILTKIYSYADIAYVGGGFGKPGVHNILEPATFGVPIIIGPNYSHFAEATALVKMNGSISITNQDELNETFDKLIQNSDLRLEKGHICSTFVEMNKNATETIMNYIIQKKTN
ncbi:MAG: 3-deoxy-D-manno-octulosonic acid transferase [Flavobacteriaceae bacterium]|nr:3-deoxy-D-manno-octulosonic acid transferase [Flavobacteriaceae bacterium]